MGFCAKLSVICVVLYIVLIFRNLYGLMNPLFGLEELLKGRHLVTPMWQDGDSYRVIGLLSKKKRFSNTFNTTKYRENGAILFDRDNNAFSDDQEDVVIERNLTMTDPMWNNSHISSSSNNIYLHVLLFEREYKKAKAKAT